MPNTPVYGWRYPHLGQEPHGPDLAEDLALDVEATVVANNAALSARILAVESLLSSGITPGEVIGCMWTNNGTVATSGGGGGEVAVPSASWDAEPTFGFRAGRIYRVTFAYTFVNTVALNTAVVRIREGAASVAGTILLVDNRILEHTAGTSNYASTSYVKNALTVTVSTKLSATVQHFTGGTTASIGGDATSPMSVTVTDMCAVSAAPDLANVAVQV